MRARRGSGRRSEDAGGKGAAQAVFLKQTKAALGQENDDAGHKTKHLFPILWGKGVFFGLRF
ncbi:MAG: hypothetical protein CW342_06070 [Thermoactinomycetaceae bacterium]|nr:hypothetical protein [Bacillota bacterium]MBO2532449.1 hypothetical protein [Thermoactinomycetaceae bacterium]